MRDSLAGVIIVRLQFRKVDVILTNSKRQSAEKATNLVVDAKLIIWDHKYRCNWLIDDCRYDVMLCMPGHHTVIPVVDCSSSVVEVERRKLPLRREEDSKVRISNLEAKKFSSLLRNKRDRNEFEVFFLFEAPLFLTNNMQKDDKNMTLIWRLFLGGRRNYSERTCRPA